VRAEWRQCRHYVRFSASWVEENMRAICFLILSINAHAAITDVVVVGTTNTQAKITYHTPSVSPCTWEISESPTYHPLITDMDPALFPSSNSDISFPVLGQDRYLIVGKRLLAKAADGRIVSRALANNTRHYFRITCGTDTAAGTFDTVPIPVGMTYQDPPQSDPAAPGVFIKPTLSTTDRNARYIDAKTGVVIRPVGLPSDSVNDGGGGAGPFMYFGGFMRICWKKPTGPLNGFLCSFAQGDGGYGEVFYIAPNPWEVRYLGRTNWTAYPSISEADGRWYEYSNDTITARQYSGDYTQVTSGTVVANSTTTLLTGVSGAIKAFSPAYDPTAFGCGLSTAEGDFLNLTCKRGDADSMGWVAIVQISKAAIVAAVRFDSNPQSRWCGIHNVQTMGDSPSVFIGPHALVGQNGNPAGGGPYQTTTTLATAAGATNICVAHEPTCERCGGASEPAVPPARIGDSFTFQDGTGEHVRITGKLNELQWESNPLVYSHAVRTALVADCFYPPIFWKFLADPHGTDATGVNFVNYSAWPQGGHDDASANVADHTKDIHLTEADGWVGVIGDLLTGIGQPLNFNVSATNAFAGSQAICFGNGCRRHPSAGPIGSGTIFDYVVHDGVPYDANISPMALERRRLINNLTQKTGQVWLYNPGSFPINQRYNSVLAKLNTNVLRDVSPAKLPADASGSWTYCIVNKPGECWTNSTHGQIYANIPVTNPGHCQPGSGNALCFSNFNSWSAGVVQMATDAQHTRLVTNGLVGNGETNDYPTAKPLPDGSHVLFTVGDTKWRPPSRLFAAQLPPLVAPDNVDRSKFVDVPIKLTNIGGGATRAAIQFGYLENGRPDQFFCTTRQEACIANTDTPPPADGVTDPFKYATSDTWSGFECATTCTIHIPVLPMHIVYFQVLWMSDTRIVSRGPLRTAGDLVPPKGSCCQ
jgi:hypothetical protein